MMDAIINWLTTTPVVALVISILIFVITLTLVVKRLIGFFITLLLLFFTIASGYAILNHQIVSDFLKNYYQESVSEKKKPQEEGANYQQKLIEGFNSLKQVIEEEQKNLSEYLKKSQSSEKK